jgi:hypothetical protein
MKILFVLMTLATAIGIGWFFLMPWLGRIGIADMGVVVLQPTEARVAIIRETMIIAMFAAAPLAILAVFWCILCGVVLFRRSAKGPTAFAPPSV